MKTRKVDVQEEQLKLLKKILVELQTLNSNLVTARAAPRLVESGLPNKGQSDDEELDEYE